MSDEDKKPIGRPFQPGVSPNPGGRPPGARKRAREVLGARSYTDPEGNEYRGSDALVAVLRDISYDKGEKARDRISAAVAAHAIAEGRPQQSVKIEDVTPVDSGIDWSKMSIEERRETLDHLRKLGVLEPSAADVGPTEH